jgi:hypothetical protein
MSPCRLIKDGGKAEELMFKSLSRRTYFAHNQEVADIVRVTTQVKPKNGLVRINLVAFDETESIPIDLKPVGCKGGYEGEYEEKKKDKKKGEEKQCVDLVIANVMQMGHGHSDYGRCLATHIARDFELYHDLMENPAWLHIRTVPHRTTFHAPGVGSLEEACEGVPVVDTFTKLLERSISATALCPMTSGSQ